MNNGFDIDKLYPSFAELLHPKDSPRLDFLLDEYQKHIESKERDIANLSPALEQECKGKKGYEEVLPEWFGFRRILCFHGMEDTDIANLYFIKWYFEQERLGQWANSERKALEVEKDDALAIESLLWTLRGEKEALRKQALELHSKEEKTPEEKSEFDSLIEKSAKANGDSFRLSIGLSKSVHHYVIGGQSYLQDHGRIGGTFNINSDSMVSEFCRMLESMLNQKNERITQLKTEITDKSNQRNKKDGPGDQHEKQLVLGLSNYIDTHCSNLEKKEQMLCIGKILFWCGVYIFKGRERTGTVGFDFKKHQTIVKGNIYNIYDENLHNGSLDQTKFVDAVKKRIKRSEKNL